ncbi:MULTISPECIES: hypothetical protein [Aquitalea]|uniref:hypothetical protein n=1 Tax=Aquitalea TaxID=407217 RepID=UPI0013150E71|nr:MULTISPECIES: hypothetical protein [Aquitalea]
MLLGIFFCSLPRLVQWIARRCVQADEFMSEFAVAGLPAAVHFYALLIICVF